MVRKYTPTVDTEWGNEFDPNSEYSVAVMEESEYGEWVKLETYLDETKRLRAMIARLENDLSETEAELYEARNGD